MGERVKVFTLHVPRFTCHCLLLTVSCLLLLAACGSDSTVERIGLEVPGGDPERGRELIGVYGCQACHSVPGVPGADGQVGPPLVFWAERHYIAGLLPNEPDNLIYWIQNPQEVEPGTAMPDMGVSEEDARHIAAYLYTLGD